ncbi:MAG: hypothetical protein K0R57_5693 [Paenibacillaceae bacterium]|jgi:hypothetical protein|nr:hypothetical protein [Paenibacillaceae bacterium]
MESFNVSGIICNQMLSLHTFRCCCIAGNEL